MKSAKFSTLLSIFLSFFFIFSSPAFANLYINEFSSAGSNSSDPDYPDWVEIYNSGTSQVNLSEYRFEDKDATNVEVLTGTIDPNSFSVVEWSNKLNKAGDIISLIKISDSSVVDRVGYGNQGSDVSAPNEGQSAGRSTDGGNSWVLFSPLTKGSTNNTSTPVPTATPTSTPTLTPTVTPSNTPAPTPTRTPTSAPTSPPTSTPKPPTATTKPTLKPTSKPTTAVFASAKKTPSPTKEVLGEKTSSSSATPTKTPEKKASGNTVVASFFTGLGLILLAFCGILGFRIYKERKNNMYGSKNDL